MKLCKSQFVKEGRDMCNQCIELNVKMPSALTISRSFFAGLLIFAAGSASPALAGDPALRPIALTQTDGELGPDLGPGVVFTSFSADLSNFVSIPSAPVINTSGDMISIASIGGIGITATNNAGIWTYRDGNLTMLAQ